MGPPVKKGDLVCIVSILLCAQYVIEDDAMRIPTSSYDATTAGPSSTLGLVTPPVGTRAVLLQYYVKYKAAPLLIYCT